MPFTSVGAAWTCFLEEPEMVGIVTEDRRDGVEGVDETRQDQVWAPSFVVSGTCQAWVPYLQS